jgi:hypothetical protein
MVKFEIEVWDLEDDAFEDSFTMAFQSRLQANRWCIDNTNTTYLYKVIGPTTEA